MMKPYANTAGNSGGFTLVEVLIAVAIFAVLATTVYTSFRAVVFRTDDIENSAGTYDMARNAFDRMRRDLEAVCITGYPAYTPPELSNSNNADLFRFRAGLEYKAGQEMSSLTFASFEHLSFGMNNRGHIGIIRYYVDEGEKGNMVLRRSDTAVLSKNLYNRSDFDDKDPVLCKDVRSFVLQFRKSDGTVRREWDSESQAFDYATPVSVEIQIETGRAQHTRLFETVVDLPVYRPKKKKDT